MGLPSRSSRYWRGPPPADPAVPWDRAYSIPLSGRALDRKRRAAQCFRSQLEPIGAGTAPMLPAFVLQRLLAVSEVVFRCRCAEPGSCAREVGTEKVCA